MKTKLLLFLLVFVLIKLSGQNYYKIVFAGNPETVFIENLTQGKSVSLPGTDTLLLKFKGTSVYETDCEHQKLTIYPNPMDQSCNFDFDNQKPGRVIIQVFNSNGSLIHKYSNKLPQGIQHFQLSGVPSGVYVIDIKTTTGHYSGSFVSTDKSNAAFLLMNKSESSKKSGGDENVKISNTTDFANTLLEYRNSIELDFATGDQLKFIAYKTGFENDTVYASPIGDSTITFIFCTKPAQPSELSGNINPCTGATESYSVSNVSGVSYTWTVPSDWNISAGQGTNSITVTAGSSSGVISVIPANNCGSGPGNSLTVTTNTVPAQPSPISGIYNPCQGATGIAYSVNNVSGITYTWSAPSDWTLTAGQNTNSITVSVGTSSGNITVIPSNDCGYGPANSFAVTAQTEALQPSAISGKENPCQGNSEIYSVLNVFGIDYIWSVPSDWTLTAGQNTNSITVTVGISIGNITVVPSNGCGNGPSRSLAVTTQTGGAGQPSAISGNNNPCQGSTGLIYSVINVASLIYTWTVPAGWSITGGQGTNSITVTAGIEAGNITVTPSNDCGNGPANSMAVTTHTVPALHSEITGDNNPCAMSEGEYSVAELPGVSYVWTVPTGWTITEGQNTNTIYIITDETSGTVGVTPSNDCGNGAARTLEVTIKDPPVQPSEISGNTNPCQGSIGLIYSVDNDLDVNYYSWTIPTGWTIISGHLTNSITVTAGTTSGNISVIPVGDCGYGTSRTQAITTKLIPSQPSSISGNSAPCEETTGLVYSVTNVPGVTHLWTVPTDWNITSGQGTNSITVTAGFDWGNITVTPSNDCGNGPTRTLAVSTQVIPDQPSAISGDYNPCQGTTGLIYSVFEESNVVYTWTVPSGWTITSGQNTNSITVTVGPTPGNIIVTPSNDCGEGPANSLAVTTQTVPEQPSAITGNTNPCESTTGLVYSVPNVPGVNYYYWTVPAGWTITSGAEENTITVTAGISSGNITVTAFNDCGEGPEQTLAVTVQLVPAQPSAISGNNNPCQGATGLTYSVTNVSGVTYTWTVPSGWTITSGQNTNSIIVTAGTASGNITVTPSNDCGNGTTRTLAVTTQTVPAQPSAISGNNNPCQGAAGLSYSVTNVSGVDYFWTVPSGWTITSGQNTNSITVTAGTTSGNITVTPSNDCGNGPANSFTVTTHTIPAQPSAISGNNNPCQGTTGLTYSVTNVAGVTYTWTVPSGWTITAGQGTSSMTATASTSSGNINVTPSNDCGNGTAQTMAVNIQLVPAQPSTITGNNNPCQGATGLNYSVTNVAGVTYTWTVPSGWTITAGQGTNSIAVTAGTSAGNINVTPSNNCGNGTPQTMAVTTQTVPAQPSAITGNNNPCQGATGLNYLVTNVSGVTYTWSVPSGWTITAGQNTNNINVTAGSASGNITVTPSNTCGTGTARTLAVTTQSVPAQPSAISGNNNPCQGTTGLSYSVTNISGVTYTWTVPSGWSITAGQGNNSITVTAGTSAGNITVTPSNTCGNGTASSLAVTTQTVPVTPTAGTHVPTQTQIIWNWNISTGATGYKYNTVNNYATATDNGSSTTYTQTGLTCNTSYTLYVWAYNTCGNSTVLQLSQTTSACSSGCVSVTFTYNGSTVTYGSVTSAGGRCWLDRNLGATQVATSSTDAAAYGDLFQWGRLDDGHQVSTSPTTSSLSNSDVPGHGNFIIATSYPYDWRSPQNNNLWQGVNGINNVCPDGYRLPTKAEWDTERLSWSSNNAAGAFASPLKLPMAGFRASTDGSINYDGSYGHYWSSTVNGVNSGYLYFFSGNAGTNNGSRASGMSVRCIKD